MAPAGPRWTLVLPVDRDGSGLQADDNAAPMNKFVIHEPD
jgi:hypothetical protein